jgi:hypothetical protein
MKSNRYRGSGDTESEDVMRGSVSSACVVVFTFLCGWIALTKVASGQNPGAMPFPEFYGVYAVSGGHLTKLDSNQLKALKTVSIKLGHRNSNGDFTQGAPVATNETISVPVFLPDVKFLVYLESGGLTNPLAVAGQFEIQQLVFVRNVFMDSGPPSNVRRSGPENGWEDATSSDMVNVATRGHAADLEFLFKPVPGKQDMVLSGFSEPLDPGLYRLYLTKPDIIQHGPPPILFAVEPAETAAASTCVDLSISTMLTLSNVRYKSCTDTADFSAATSSATEAAPQPPLGSGVPSDCGQEYAACMRKADEAEQTSNWNQALADYLTASQAAPRAGEPWRMMAFIKLTQGSFDEAKQSLSKTLDLGFQVGLPAIYKKNFLSNQSGFLIIGREEVKFMAGSSEVFRVPISQVSVVDTGAAADVDPNAFYFDLPFGGKKHRFEYQPHGVPCSFGNGNNLLCDGNGIDQQRAVAEWVRDAVAKYSARAPSTP